MLQQFYKGLFYAKYVDDLNKKWVLWFLGGALAFILILLVIYLTTLEKPVGETKNLCMNMVGSFRYKVRMVKSI